MLKKPTKKTKKKYSVSEGYLDAMWSKVICEKYNRRCALCNMPGQGQSHHIIRRAKRVLRWHPLNGIYLCMKHHEEAHTAKGAREIQDFVGADIMEYLYGKEKLTLKDFCTGTGWTVDEFRAWSLKRLKECL